MAKDRRGMPLLLRGAMVVGVIMGTLGTVGCLWALGRVVTFGGPFQFNDTTVARADFLGVAVPFLLLLMAACLTAGAASWALWKRRVRSRSILVGLLAELVVGDAAMLLLASRMLDVTSAELASSALFFAVLVALGLWYLFRKDSVVRYYESIRPFET